MTKNKELVENLIKELKLRKYSFQTIKNYKYIVEKFLSSEKSIKNFLLDYVDKSNSGMRGNYFALKFFYENVLNQNFKGKIPIAKNARKLPIVLNKIEINNMINATDNLKHKIVTMLLYYAGLRLNEVINLKWSDVDFKRDIIHVKIAKGSNERIIFLHPKLKQYLILYGIKKHGLIVNSNSGKKYSKRTIQQIIIKTSKKAKINEHVTPHKLRHSFATHLLDSGADIKSIQYLLGHKNLKSTQIYVHVSNKNIKNLARLL